MASATSTNPPAVVRQVSESDIYVPFGLRGKMRAEQTEKGIKFIRITE